MGRIADELIKTIQIIIDKKLENYKADRTYRTVVRGINRKGYVILDRAGGERTVKCSIPRIELKPGQQVWVKEPMGDFKDLHICGVINK